MNLISVLHIKLLRITAFSLVVLLISLFSFVQIRAQVAPDIPEYLKLKASKSDLLGHKEIADGLVKYAYKSNIKLSNIPSASVLLESQRRGTLIVEEVIKERTKHSRTFKTSDPNKYITEIIGGDPQYYKDSNGEWWQADYGTTTKEVFLARTKPSIFARIFKDAIADTDTFYPDANPESNTVDGYIRGAGQSTWDAVHDSAGAEAFPSDSNMVINSLQDGGGYSIRRIAVLFNTSTIPDTNNIDGATFSLYAYGKTNTDNDGDDFISVVTSNPASNSDLVATDFDDIGDAIDNPTEQHDTSERKDLTDVTTSQYVDWILNSTGLNNINKTGVTKFGAREGHDILDTAITSSTKNELAVYAADEVGTDKDPKLTVLHSVPPPSFTEIYSVRKSANTSRFATSTLQADNELVLGLAPNKEYIVDGVIFASSTSATPDIKIGWSFSEMTVDLGFLAAGDTSFRLAELIQKSNTDSSRIPLAANISVIIKVSGTVLVGNASSTLSFMWAQATANATPTNVLRGSYISATEIP